VQQQQQQVQEHAYGDIKLWRLAEACVSRHGVSAEITIACYSTFRHAGQHLSRLLGRRQWRGGGE
jgi:hypothetical protein